MGKSYRPYLPDQEFLLPPSLRDWLPENHLVYFVSDVIDNLNLSAMDAVYGNEKRGQPPYDPRMMTKILVYGYCVGVYSSRRIQQRLAEDIAFRVLAAGNGPNFRTISDFRKIHLATLEGLFEQVLKIALEAGAMKLGRVALDGTKVKANASKHKAMSYDRMKEKERQIRAEVRELLAQAEAADAEEDALYGADQRGDELPEELQRRETRLQKIREAKRALEERARQTAEKDGKPAGEVKQVKPAAKDQYNFTDPESRIMMGSDGLVQGYNAQAAVEPALQFGEESGASGNGRRVGAQDRWLYRHWQAEAWRTPPAVPAGTVTPACDTRGAHEAQTADQSGTGSVRCAQNDGGAGFRTDQTSARISAVSIARVSEGSRGMGPGMPDPQHFKIVPSDL